ncbi:MAG: DUF547 domain-containing protein [Candidatus Omnitrophica bacterium]|nr:DUF547 domain-containing protein [Candidatus Omnitrophota bacterium]
MMRKAVSFLFFLLLTLGFATTVFAFDYLPFNSVLKKYCENQKVDAPELQQFLASYRFVSSQQVSEWSREEQLAFWINAFNALSLLKADKLKLGDRSYQLNEIKGVILRRQFRDERIYFALIDFDKNAPSIRKEAYEGSRLDQQLDDQIRKFLSDKSKNLIEPKSKKVVLSYIFKEYADDFLLNYGSFESRHKKFTVAQMAVLSFIAQHSSPDTVKYLEAAKYKIQYFPRETGHLN